MSITININASSASELSVAILELAAALSGNVSNTPVSETQNTPLPQAPQPNPLPTSPIYQQPTQQFNQIPTTPSYPQTQPTLQFPPAQQQPMYPPQAAPPPIPTSTQTYSQDQLAVAATQLVDAGRRTELVSLLSSFGVQALTSLPKEQYGDFATHLRAMGAKI